MSEPMSTHDIEDVLSSIRRLVSDDLRPATGRVAGAVTGAVAADRLILTPALRVVGEAGDERVKDAVSEGGSSFAPAPQPVLPAAPEQGLGDRLPNDLTPISADIPADGDMAALADADSAAAEVAPQAGAEPLFLSSRAPQPGADADPAEDLAAAFAALVRGGASSGWAEADTTEVAPQQPDVADDLELPSDPDQAAFAAAETLVWSAEAGPDQAEAEDEPADVAPYMAAYTAPAATDAAPWLDVSPAGPGWVEDAGDWVEEQPLAFVAPQPRRAPVTPDPLAKAWADQAEAAVRAELEQAATAAAAKAEAAAGFFVDDAGPLDEEALREIVRDIIREELAGTLGERITRNVRKLVRVEINRALAAREFE